MNFRISKADTDLPPEFQQVAELLAQQPPEVPELLRYALVLAMIDEKARVIGTREENGQEYLTVETVKGRGVWRICEGA